MVAVGRIRTYAEIRTARPRKKRVLTSSATSTLPYICDQRRPFSLAASGGPGECLKVRRKESFEKEPFPVVSLARLLAAETEHCPFVFAAMATLPEDLQERVTQWLQWDSNPETRSEVSQWQRAALRGGAHSCRC